MVRSENALLIPGTNLATLAYLPDDHSELTIRQVEELDAAGVFKPVQTISSLPVTNQKPREHRWFKLVISNQEAEHRQFVLDLIWRIYDEVVLYQRGIDGQWQSLSKGEKISAIPKSARWMAFDLKILPHEKRVIFLYVQDYYRLPSKFLLWPDANDFISWERFEYAKHFCYFGLVFGMLVLSIFRYALMREPDQLHYLLFLAFYSSMSLCGSGLVSKIIPGFISPIADIVVGWLGCMSMMQLCVFARHFLAAKGKDTKMDRVMRWLQWLWLICPLSLPMILWPTLGFLYMSILFSLAAGSVGVLLVAAVRRWRTGSIEAFFFLIAFLPMLFGFAFRLTNLQDSHTRDDEQRLVSILCSALNITLLSLAMTYRKRQVMLENYKLQFDYAEDLEREVADRTIELENTLCRLSETVGQRDRLLMIIGHDLRGPAISLYTLTSSINAGMDWTKEELTDWTVKIGRNCVLQLELLNNLLTWGAMQSNHWKSSPDKLHLKSEIDAVWGMQKELGKIKNITFVNTVHENLYAYADSQLFQTVIRNLMGNAIKFSHIDGKIEVGAVAVKNDFIEIFVRDNGVGIHRGRQKTLFDGHVESTEGTESEKGTGIGLGICRDLVENAGGHIWVKSEINQGATLFFTLPRFRGSNSDKFFQD